MKKFSYNISKVNSITNERKLVKVTVSDNRERYRRDIESLKDVFITLQKQSYTDGLNIESR